MKKFFYRVQKGESVTSLSVRFGVAPVTVIKANRLTGEVEEGDIIYVEETGGTVYDVQPFDTLENIAERFGVAPETLKDVNGVDYLFYGLKIIIPEA